MIEENIRRFSVVVAVELASLAFAFAWLLHDAGVLGWWLVRSKHCMIVILHAFYLRFCFSFWFLRFVGGIGGPSSPMFNRRVAARRFALGCGDTFADLFPNAPIAAFLALLMILFVAFGFFVSLTFAVATGGDDDFPALLGVSKV